MSADEHAAIDRRRREATTVAELPPRKRAELDAALKALWGSVLSDDFRQAQADVASIRRQLRQPLPRLWRTLFDLQSSMTPPYVKARLIWFLPEMLAGRRLPDRQVRARVRHLQAILDRASRSQLLRLAGRPLKDEHGRQVRGQYDDDLTMDEYVYWIRSQLARALRGARNRTEKPRRRTRRARPRPPRRSTSPDTSRTKRTV